MKSIKRHTIIFVILNLSLSIPGYATDYTIGNTGGPNNYDSLEEFRQAITLGDGDSITLYTGDHTLADNLRLALPDPAYGKTKIIVFDYFQTNSRQCENQK